MCGTLTCNHTASLLTHWKSKSNPVIREAGIKKEGASKVGVRKVMREIGASKVGVRKVVSEIGASKVGVRKVVSEIEVSKVGVRKVVKTK